MSIPKKLETQDFTGDPAVLECLRRLKEKYPAGNPLVVSDVLDDEGHQYVHLVQKGGGVLGVALVGYTYVLEEMGIRFLKQAGTSAGAINTALMTVIGNKQDPKSVRVLDVICKLDFFSLVDGHPFARRVIKSFIRNNNFVAAVERFVFVMLSLFVLSLTGSIVFANLKHTVPSLSLLSTITLVSTIVFIVIAAIVALYIRSLFKRLKNAGYGINPGKVFYNWIELQLQENGVKTVSDLNEKAKAVPRLHLRVPHEKKLDELTGPVTFITSELVTENKIQLPAMCNLFRKEEDFDSLPPAGFIRASMSIPLFFESYIIHDIPCEDEEIKEAWKALGVYDPPSTARFVDGGVLSNFPVSIFYIPEISIPRLPVFGIDLDDSLPEDNEKNSVAWTLTGYLGRLFNTIRNYYDKDFLIKNRIYEKGIGKVKVANYNWLNFFLSDREKKELFVLGAKAATEFLENFNWNEYKGNRQLMEGKLKSK
ncbi:MAG: patatin-like phospholipase family protein [Chitinophagaceae bacterium]|nr:patatin-like phospholipase family protein [Chitinophagaceae bacterium]